MIGMLRYIRLLIKTLTIRTLDSQLGNLGGHEQRTPNGLPVANEASIVFAKVCIALRGLSVNWVLTNDT